MICAAVLVGVRLACLKVGDGAGNGGADGCRWWCVIAAGIVVVVDEVEEEVAGCCGWWQAP